jgi:hypothetical protein
MSLDGLAPELVWGLIPRFVGVTYLVAFGALIPQIEVQAGSRGQLPVRSLLARVRRDFPGPRRFFEYPTLLWINDSDFVLKAMPIVGTLCGLLAIYGGGIGYVALLLGWVLWLSIEPAGLIFPWDTMLQEMGFLVLFLPAALPLPNLHASALPLPTVAFMVRWLVLRLMFGFGKDKFMGITKGDALYLRGFFVWMPLPNPLGWFGHHAPGWILKASHYFMFFAEIIAPLLGLFAGPLRLVAYAGLVGLMIGIQLTGNWGYFNIGYILLCTCLLDVHSSIFDLAKEPWAGQAAHFPDLAMHALMLLMFLTSIFHLPLNSWCTRGWVHWPPNIVAWKGRRIRVLFAFFRALDPLRFIAPFRLVNAYGVFPPNSSPPLRIVPVLEGSDDGGASWKQYGYKHMPAFAKSRPPFIAPYHSRLDQWTYYIGNGIHTASLFGPIMLYGIPYYSYARASWLDVTAQRLLEGDPLHLRALGHNPFPDAPPKLVRVGILAMTPTRPSELRATGRWWHVQRLGTVSPPRGKERWPDAFSMPEPELFHPDFVAVKRRARPLRAMVAAYRAGMPLDRAVIEGSDLTAADLTRFWSELVPMLAENRGDWTRIHERADALQQRYTVEAQQRLERVLERYAWLLQLRIEEAHVQLPPMSNFRQHMLIYEIIIDGREAYEQALTEPERAVERWQRTTEQSQLWVLSLMRYEQVMAHVCGFRWCEVGLRAHEQGLPGLFEYYEFLVQQVPRGEEFCPRPVKHADGEYTIEGFYPPPPLRAS